LQKCESRLDVGLATRIYLRLRLREIEGSLPIGIEQVMEMIPPDGRNCRVPISDRAPSRGGGSGLDHRFEALAHVAIFPLGEFSDELRVEAKQPRRDRTLSKTRTKLDHCLHGAAR